jgi:hypothetical protein
MRLNYSDDEDRPGQFALWQANCDRSIKGQIGQRELRELEAALLAMPEKRLIHGALADEDGGVCAIGCYAKHKGLDLSKFDPEDESDEVGIKAGMPRLVAWKVVELNDIELAEKPDWFYDARSDGPNFKWKPYTPEERYEKVLAWVRSQLSI